MCNHYHQVTSGVCLLRRTWHAGAVYPSCRGKYARPNAVALPAWNQRNHRALLQLAAKKTNKKKICEVMSEGSFSLHFPLCIRWRAQSAALCITAPWLPWNVPPFVDNGNNNNLFTASHGFLCTATAARRKKRKKKLNIHIQHVLPADVNILSSWARDTPVDSDGASTRCAISFWLREGTAGEPVAHPLFQIRWKIHDMCCL